MADFSPPPSTVSVEIDRSIRQRDFQRKTLAWLLLVYWIPLILVTVYYAVQFNAFQTTTHRLRMQSIAENQAHLLNLFLRERVTKLVNAIDDPRFSFPPSEGEMNALLAELKKNNPSYVDVGFFDLSGVQTVYAGPYPSLQGIDYSGEAWYRRLKRSTTNYVISDDYMGFRKKPHFTIAVSRIVDARYYVLRATLDPVIIYEYIASVESELADVSIVNAGGDYQVVNPLSGRLLEPSSIVPPRAPKTGIAKVDVNGDRNTFAYSWLHEMDWALIVRWSQKRLWIDFLLANFKNTLFSLVVLAVLFVFIRRRAKQLSSIQCEQEQTQMQLQHAAKLASIGELAAGIAHEINNPLAIVCSETGLMKDLFNPAFGENPTKEEIVSHLDNVREAAFRCRDITRHLLEFVRTTDPKIELYDLHTILNEVVEKWMGRKLLLANIEIRKKYASNILEIETDRNRLQQVLLNLFSNAKDAIGRNGWIEVETGVRDGDVYICITDSGRGMSPEELEKIFLPFYTTKEVGKGTGLGLSVSYNIIKKLGGKITVESRIGVGSAFTVILPQTQPES